MSNVFKRVLISTEIAYIGQLPENTILDKVLEPEPVISHLDLEKAYNQGLADGIAKERALLQEQAKALNTLLNSIPKTICDFRQQLSAEISDIVMHLAKQFFINQQHNKDDITDNINQIITQLNDKQNIEVALHPRELALVSQDKLIQTHQNLRFVPDENLRLGGCIVKSEHGVFDADIERQIDHLKQVLLQIRTGE